MSGARAALLSGGALAFAAIGVWATLDPVGALAQVGVVPVDARGWVELRAMYGGLELGAAVFLALCAARPAWHAPGLVASACLIGGLGVARVGWLAVHRPPGALLYVFAAFELTNGVACLALLRPAQVRTGPPTGQSTGL